MTGKDTHGRDYNHNETLSEFFMPWVGEPAIAVIGGRYRHVGSGNQR
jgi:hypothetical protein